MALLLVAYSLRLFRLGDQNVWWDEALAVWAARKPIVETTLWTAGDVHPPLFFWTLWPWLRLAGETEFALRYLTVCWGMLSAAVAFALGRRVGGSRAGLLALALVAMSRFAVWWSTELRMYMLAALAVTVAVYATQRWLDAAARARSASERRGSVASAPGSGSASLGGGPGPWNRWLLLAALASAAALYTVYLAAAAIAILSAAVILAWLLRRVERTWLVAWLAGLAAVALLLLPWLAVALPRMQSWRTVVEAASLRFVGQLWATLVSVGQSTDLDAVRVPVLAFWAAAFACVIPLLRAAFARREGEGGARDRRPALALLTAFLIAPPVIVWYATLPRSVFYSPRVEARYFVPFVVPAYVLVGWALGWIIARRRAAGLIAVSLVLVPLLASLPYQYAERRMKGELYAMSLAIWSQAEPGDAVVLVSGNRYPLFHYYYDRPWVRKWGEDPYEFPADRPPRWSDRPPVIDFPDRGSATVESVDWETDLAEIVAVHGRVWLVEYGRDLQDPERRVEGWLTAHLPRVLSESYGADALHLYAKDGAVPRVTGLSSRFPGTRVVSRPEPRAWVAAARRWLDGGRATSVAAPTAGDPTAQPRAAADRPPGAGGSILPAAPAASLAPVIGLATRELLAPDEFDVTLFAVTDGSPVVALVSMSNANGVSAVTVARAEADAPATGANETTGLARVRSQLPVDERLPGGTHGLGALVSARPATAPPSGLDLASVRVRGAAPPLSSSAALGTEDVPDFGPVELVSAEVGPRTIRAGEDVLVDLYWRHQRGRMPPLTPPVVFAHLVGPPREPGGDPVWAVQDGDPSSGPWPWQLGLATGASASVFDRHVLRVDPAAPPGAYRVEVGLYDSMTGERLGVTGGGADSRERRVLLGDVTVR